MKLCVLLSVCILFLSGCLSSTVYDLSLLTSENKYPIAVVDKREVSRVKTLSEGMTFVLGDENIIPSPLNLISMKLNDYLLPTSAKQIESISLNNFDVVVYFPNMGAIGAGASMAAVSYPAGILVAESSNSGPYRFDGVIANIKMSFNEVEYACNIYIEASEEIRALMGIQMTSKKMPKPIDAAISKCVFKLVEQTPFDRKKYY